MSNIMAIDPGNTMSAYCIMDDSLSPLDFGKVENTEILNIIEFKNCNGFMIKDFIIERVACYGMPVGRDVFDTCEWIGRFTQAILTTHGIKAKFVYRNEEKLTICHSSKAGDKNIRRALIDRFAKYDFKNGKGTKEKPDWFYGFKADIWSAYAVGVTFKEMEAQKKCSGTF